LLLGSVALALLRALPAAWAQTAVATRWPPKVVRIIVPLTPGGGVDDLARRFSEHLHARYGTTVIVETRPGAGGLLAMRALASAVPDGSTIGLVSTSTMALLPELHQAKLGYDPERNIKPAAMIAEYFLVLVVRSELPVRNLEQFISLARQQPNELTYGSGGLGTSVHLAALRLNQLAGIRALHVAYAGTPEYVVALAGGQIDYALGGWFSVAPFVAAGKVRPIAVIGDERLSMLPDVPAIAETLPAAQFLPWAGLAAPGATPADVVQGIAAEARAFLQSPSVRSYLLAQGARPVWRDSADLVIHVQGERLRYGAILRAAREPALN
jgi:tripartite-type tricarboxylate transporter receptor subunit TctC